MGCDGLHRGGPIDQCVPVPTCRMKVSQIAPVPDVTGVWHFIPCVLLREKTFYYTQQIKARSHYLGRSVIFHCDPRPRRTTSGGTCPRSSLRGPPSVPSFEAQQGSGESSTVSACGKWSPLNRAVLSSVVILVGNRPQNWLPVSTYAAKT